jgi:hypothetical protein
MSVIATGVSDPDPDDDDGGLDSLEKIEREMKQEGLLGEDDPK